MRNLILVAFLESVADDLEFPRTDWPLHITLVKFDVDGAAGAEVTSRILALAEAPVTAALGARLTIGEDAGFGHLGLIPVSLVEPSLHLQALHESLAQLVAGLPGRIAAPHYTMENYRPHVSHHGDRRVNPGDAVALDRVALVDMAPDGGHATRRILHLWALPEDGL